MGKAEKGGRQGSSAPNLTKEVVNSQMPPLPSPTYFLAPTIMYGGILPFPPCANRKCKEGRERRSGEGILRPEIQEAEGDLEKVHTGGGRGQREKAGKKSVTGWGALSKYGIPPHRKDCIEGQTFTPRIFLLSPSCHGADRLLPVERVPGQASVGSGGVLRAHVSDVQLAAGEHGVAPA